MAKRQPLRSDWVGSLIGLLVFVGGIGLLVVTFQMAFAMFNTPPSVVLSDPGTKAVDLTKAGESLSIIVIKVMVLLVMCIVGSVVANRGIRLYVTCRSPKEPDPEPLPPEPESSNG